MALREGELHGPVYPFTYPPDPRTAFVSTEFLSLNAETFIPRGTRDC